MLMRLIVGNSCTAISNHDFDEFFARHVTGTLDPPLQECFGHAGIEYTEAHELSTALPFSFSLLRRAVALLCGEGILAQVFFTAILCQLQLVLALGKALAS